MDQDRGHDPSPPTPPANSGQDADSAPHPPPAPLVPPHWSHRRHESYLSLDDDRSKRAPILLEDNTGESSERSSSCWARAVSIDEHVIVAGSVQSAGNFVVFNCRVETLDGGSFVIRKRYSEFDDLRARLLSTFPHAGQALPPLPPKSVIFRFRPRFLEKRREGLAFFLNCVLLNPEFSSAPVTKDFIFN